MKNLFISIALLLLFITQSFSQQNTNTWTWIGGTNLYNQFGFYGNQGQADINNISGARSNGSTWSLNNKLYLFGGFGYSTNNFKGLNDLWSYDINLNNWTWLNGSSTSTNVPTNYGAINVPLSSNQPGARTKSVTWVYQKKLYLFGGEDEVTRKSLNDLWEFNLETNIWTWIKGSNTTQSLGIYGVKGEFNENNTPGARFDASGWVYNDRFYLFGGETTIPIDETNSQVVTFNDVWEFDPIDQKWRWLKGYNGNQSIAGTYGVKGVESPNNYPGSRKEHFTWILGDAVYIYGGNGYAEYGISDLSDFWKFNLSTNNWTWLGGSKMPNALFPNYGQIGISSETNYPGTRLGKNNWTYNNKLFLALNGADNSTIGYRNDIWEYNLKNNLWTWVKGSNLKDQYGAYGTIGLAESTNTPGARSYSQGWFNEGVYYLFGGYGKALNPPSQKYDNLNDFWTYTPTCSNLYPIANGNWNDPATWSCNKIPTASDDVYIDGFNITISNNSFAKNIIYANGGSIDILNGGNLELSSQ